ncbi:Synembryn-B [Entophlyctis luteolus]|nr:Synembryn-B [Entophlyctis luteolus]
MSLVTPLGLPSALLLKQPVYTSTTAALLSAFIHQHASDFYLLQPKGKFTLEDKSESVRALVDAFSDHVIKNDSDESCDPEDTAVWTNWSDDVAANAFESLKILARETDGCEALMSKPGIEMLMTHIGLRQKITFPITSRCLEAMKCLVNCLHASEACRNEFVKANGIESIVEFLTNEKLPLDAKFLAFRVLFLLSGHSADHASRMKGLPRFGIFLEQQLVPYANHLMNQSPITNAKWNELSLVDEILKVLFNVTMLREFGGGGLGGILGGKSVPKTKQEKIDIAHKEWSQKEEFVKGYENLLPVLVDMITCIPVAEKDPLSAPHAFCINCLLNYPASPTFFLACLPNDNKDKIPDILCKILSLSLSLALPYDADRNPPLDQIEEAPTDPTIPDYSKKRANEIIPPVMLVLKELARSHDALRKILRDKLAPDDIDRTKKLDSSDTVTSRLIKLLTSVSMENAKEAAGELLFALFDEDASNLTGYVGYGNAAGFLFHRGIMADPNGSVASTSENSEATSYDIYDGPTDSDRTQDRKGKSPSVKSSPKKKLNPITGEIQAENIVNEEWDRLTEEEKEQEKEKLMEMLDKLNRSGVIRAVHKSELEGHQQ